MSTQTVQLILMRVANSLDEREAFLLFAIPDPEGIPGHKLQCHCALVHAFAADPSVLANVQLGNTLVIEGPGDFAELARDRLQEILGAAWKVDMFRQGGGAA